MNAVQCDIVNEPMPFPDNSSHFCLFLFVLSAITPEKYPEVIQKLAKQMVG